MGVDMSNTDHQRRRRRVVSVCAAVLCSLAMAAGRSGAQTAQRYTLPGTDVAIWNLVGSIVVERGTGSDVLVEVTRRGPDASRLAVETGRVRGQQSLRVIYPTDRVVFPERRRSGWYGESRTTVYVAADGTFGDYVHGRGERIEIRSSGAGLEASADVRVRVPPKGRVQIHLAAGEASVSGVDGDLVVDVQAARITTIGTQGALSLDAGSGDVRVTDAVGDVLLDAGSGAVTLTRVSGSSLRVDAGSGEIRGTDVDVRELQLDTGSGRVALRGVRAPDIQLDTGSGSVELLLAADVERLTVDSGSGSVTIGVPESLGATLTAETGSGGIDVDFPLTVTRRGRDYLRAQLGDGRGRIEIDAGSGAIRLRRS
jgi:hypothetical protein